MSHESMPQEKFHFFKFKSIFLILFLLLINFACTVAGTVSSEDENNYKIVTKDKISKFRSPEYEIQTAEQKLNSFYNKVSWDKYLGSDNFKQYLQQYESLDQLEIEQDDVENELKEKGELELTDGRSYSFELDSFCIDLMEHSPLTGDGYKISKITGKAKYWLPELL